MALALRDDLPTGLLHKLIVEDVAPQISSRVSKEFIGYAAGMRALADARPQSRKEADEMMLDSAPVRLSFLKEASGTDHLSSPSLSHFTRRTQPYAHSSSQTLQTTDRVPRCGGAYPTL